MGKNSTIKSLGRVIANVVVHKITLKYGSKPESRGKTSNEINAYRDNAIDTAQEFNWNDEDKSRIKIEVFEEFNRKMKSKYSDINFPMEDAEKMIDETINECGLSLME